MAINSALSYFIWPRWNVNWPYWFKLQMEEYLSSNLSFIGAADVVPSFTGTTALYPTINYTFANGNSANGNLNYYQPFYDCSLLSNQGSGPDTYYSQFTFPGSPGFAMYRVTNVPVWSNNSQSGAQLFEQSSLYRPGPEPDAWRPNTTFSPGVPLWSNRKRLSPDGYIAQIYNSFQWQVTESAVTGRQYIGPQTGETPYQKAVDVQTAGNFNSPAYKTAGWVAYYTGVESFFKQIGADYATLYTEYLTVMQAYQDAMNQSNSNALDSGFSSAEPVPPSSQLATPSIDLPVATRKAEELLDKSMKLNEELKQLTDIGMEINPHFAKLTNKMASFAQETHARPTFRGVVDQTSLRKRGGRKG